MDSTLVLRARRLRRRRVGRSPSSTGLGTFDGVRVRARIRAASMASPQVGTAGAVSSRGVLSALTPSAGRGGAVRAASVPAPNLTGRPMPAVSPPDVPAAAASGAGTVGRRAPAVQAGARTARAVAPATLISPPPSVTTAPLLLADGQDSVMQARFAPLSGMLLTTVAAVRVVRDRGR